MARPLRLEFPGAVWHIHNRGNNRGDIFLCDDDRILFLELVAETARRYNWIVIKYMLMTNHYHLIIETPETTLSRGMKWLAGTYVSRFNKKYQQCGPLFQGRFKSHLVEKNSYLLELMRYLDLNPVRAGMVKRPEDYLWGSYRAAAGYEEAPSWLRHESVLAQFGPDRASQQREYRKFVDSGAGIERAPWEDAVGQLFIGSEEWVAQMRAQIESKPRSSEHPAAQRYASRPSVARVVEVVASVFEATEEEIRNGHGTVERRVVAWLGCYESMARLGAIAAVLRLNSSSRVSALIAACDRDVDREAQLRDAIDRCLNLLRRERVPAPVFHREIYPSTMQHVRL